MINNTPRTGDRITENGVPTDQFQVLLEEIENAINKLSLPSYTVTTVPDATLSESHLIYVSDESGGATLAFSDGTNWRRVQDRAIIS